MNNNVTVQQDSSETSITKYGSAATLSQTTGESTSQAENNETDMDDAAQTVSIGPQAIAIAHSIVNTALTQLCKYHLHADLKPRSNAHQLLK